MLRVKCPGRLAALFIGIQYAFPMGKDFTPSRAGLPLPDLPSWKAAPLCDHNIFFFLIFVFGTIRSGWCSGNISVPVLRGHPDGMWGTVCGVRANFRADIPVLSLLILGTFSAQVQADIYSILAEPYSTGRRAPGKTDIKYPCLRCHVSGSQDLMGSHTPALVLKEAVRTYLPLLHGR